MHRTTCDVYGLTVQNTCLEFERLFESCSVTVDSITLFLLDKLSALVIACSNSRKVKCDAAAMLETLSWHVHRFDFERTRQSLPKGFWNTYRSCLS